MSWIRTLFGHSVPGKPPRNRFLLRKHRHPPQAANIAATIVVAITRTVRLVFPSIPLTQSPTDLLGEHVAPLGGSLPDSVALLGTLPKLLPAILPRSSKYVPLIMIVATFDALRVRSVPFRICTLTGVTWRT